MKKIVFLILLVCLPFISKAQLIGVGGEFSDFKHGAFVASVNIPLKHNLAIPDAPNSEEFAANLLLDYLNGGKRSTKKNINFMYSIGVDYVTGAPKISGFFLKPLSLNLGIIDFRKKTYYSVGLDGGYNINITHGNDGFLVSPHLYGEWGVLYSKIGYDYNLSHSQGQFYVRLGLTFPLTLM